MLWSGITTIPGIHICDSQHNGVLSYKNALTAATPLPYSYTYICAYYTHRVQILPILSLPFLFSSPPSLSACSCICAACRENAFIYIPPGSPDSNATCQSCPMNSSSAAGRFRVCECDNGTARISEALGMLNATEPCSSEKIEHVMSCER